MATPLISENFADLLEPGLRKIFDDQYKALPSMVPSLYDMRTSSTSYEKESSIGAFGDFSDFDATGQVVYDDVSQGYDVKMEFKQWVSGFQVERKLFDKQNCRTKIGLNRWNSLVDNTEERLVTC